MKSFLPLFLAISTLAALSLSERALAAQEDLPNLQCQPYKTGGIYADGLTETSLEEALSSVRPGDVVVLGEQHGTLEQAGQQSQVIETIKKNGLKVSVGMEFFYYPQQPLVDQWRAGALTEADFLTAIGWGAGFPFDAYRRQVSLPGPDEFVIALNAPRSLTGKIAKSGLDSLTAEEQSLMPPNFQLGNTGYLERFREAMGGHIPSEQALLNYFTAQSVWDETMAWQAKEFLDHNPDQVLVIIVGEFHVQYGGGLPDRLQARGVKNIHSFSLVNLHGLNDEQSCASVAPDTKYGARSNYVWISRIQ